MIMTKISYVCLLLLAYICFSRGEDPIKSVSCDVQGTVTATLKPDSPWTLPEKATCGQEKGITKVQDTFTISGCGIGTGVVLVFNKTNPETTVAGHGVVALTPKSETKTVTLTCNTITRDVTQVAKLKPWIIATVTDHPVTKSATENIVMVMELRKAADPTAKVTSMSLNGTYFLLIAGAGTHRTDVTECTAAGSPNAAGVNIYKQSSSVDPPHVLTEFNSSGLSKEDIGGKTVNQKATLTGFRLVGSETVYLTCNIKVYADATNKRKRKGGKHRPQVHYATLKLSVRDNVFVTPVSGAADTFPVASSLWRFILMSILLHFIY